MFSINVFSKIVNFFTHLAKWDACIFQRSKWPCVWMITQRIFPVVSSYRNDYIHIDHKTRFQSNSNQHCQFKEWSLVCQLISNPFCRRKGKLQLYQWIHKVWFSYVTLTSLPAILWSNEICIYNYMRIKYHSEFHTLACFLLLLLPSILFKSTSYSYYHYREKWLPNSK